MDLWKDHLKKKDTVQEYLFRCEEVMRQVSATDIPKKLTHRFQVNPEIFNGYEGYCLTNNTFGPIPTKETLIGFLKRFRGPVISPSHWPTGCSKTLPVAQWLEEIYKEQHTMKWLFSLAPVMDYDYKSPLVMKKNIRNEYHFHKVSASEKKKSAQKFINRKIRSVSTVLGDNHVYLLERVHRALVSQCSSSFL